MFSHLGESDPDEPSENGSDHGDIATTQRFIIQLILILFSIPQKFKVLQILLTQTKNEL
jgi:hypothetical protein